MSYEEFNYAVPHVSESPKDDSELYQVSALPRARGQKKEKKHKSRSTSEVE